MFIVLAVLFVALSDRPSDVLANAVALCFVNDMDNTLFRYTSSQRVKNKVKSMKGRTETEEEHFHNKFMGLFFVSILFCAILVCAVESFAPLNDCAQSG